MYRPQKYIVFNVIGDNENAECLKIWNNSFVDYLKTRPRDSREDCGEVRNTETEQQISLPSLEMESSGFVLSVDLSITCHLLC
jgi:hypothetical protein